MFFSNQLITWYLQNKRQLPWRETRDPYLIWLSEIILQQTRVAQGLPYFLNFQKAFPTVFELATADEETVLKLWQGLGYYSRARNLHQTAKQIVAERNGIFPSTYKELLTLKGIGRYTAAAIASFAYQEVVPVIDGNAYRVLSRFFGIETDISCTKAYPEFFALASELIDPKRPDLFNQAIMEFGALQCVPKNPNCEQCPLQSGCLALAHKKTTELPVKNKKTTIQKRHLNYIVYLDLNQKSLFQKRTEKGIWHNLYEFPCIETEKASSEKTIKSLIEKQCKEISEIKLLASESIIHKLSHQHLNIRFWVVKRNDILENGLSHAELLQLPVPIVLHNFLTRQKF